MNKSLIVENRNLRATVHRLQKENESLREQCSDNCHESTIEELRVKYAVPKWILSDMSYEILETKDFAEIEKYMMDRAMLFNTRPKIVKEV